VPIGDRIPILTPLLAFHDINIIDDFGIAAGSKLGNNILDASLAFGISTP
jgi:hypothetical protein